MKTPTVPLLRALAGLSSAERGATAVEYALLVTLIAAVIIGTVATLGIAVPGLYDVPWPD